MIRYASVNHSLIGFCWVMVIIPTSIRQAYGSQMDTDCACAVCFLRNGCFEHLISCVREVLPPGTRVLATPCFGALAPTSVKNINIILYYYFFIRAVWLQPAVPLLAEYLALLIIFFSVSLPVSNARYGAAWLPLGFSKCYYYTSWIYHLSIIDLSSLVFGTARLSVVFFFGSFFFCWGRGGGLRSAT